MAVQCKESALRNFIPFDSDKVCMGWTWYLGNLAAKEVETDRIIGNS